LLTGFNTDIPFNGKTYHVQTEDREGDDPIFESLVYARGQILDAYRTRYANLVAKGYDLKALAGVLESQHKRIIRWIKNGRYDPEAQHPFGEGIISDRSLDEVVLEFLQAEGAGETADLRVEEVSALAPGWTGAVRATLRTSKLSRPLAGCPVVVELLAAGKDSGARLAQGETDGQGMFLVEVTLPDARKGAEVRVTVATPLGTVEGRLPVKIA
jgi:hypothetical protein